MAPPRSFLFYRELPFGAGKRPLEYFGVNDLLKGR